MELTILISQMHIRKNRLNKNRIKGKCRICKHRLLL